jgi:hypothetical protein
MTSNTMHRVRRIAVLLAALGGTAALSDVAMAQLSTATIKGQVSVAGSPARSATQVTATNTSTGLSYRASTLADGSYVLPGLPPGSYEIRVAGGAKSEVVTVHVGDTASVDLALASDTDRVVISGSAQRAEVRSSEVGTRVATELIDRLPQINRNFLSFADLAPGVRLDNNKIYGGAQSSDAANIFIDGVSQKGNAMRGGIAGQGGSSWTSPGNPFPQSAIAEYKVITQNYKAEYDQLSSTAITAVTKSGTNELHGEVFWDYTNDKLTDKDPFQKKKEVEQGVARSPFTQYQYGFNLGGPIVQDRIHFFVAYEGKKNENSWQSALQNFENIANAGVMPELRKQTGSGKDKFDEDLLFGRVDWALSENQRLEITFKTRREKATGMQNNGASGVNTTKSVANDEDRFVVKHILTGDRYTNEALLGYEKTHFNPYSGTAGPSYIYMTTSWATILQTGGVRNFEDKSQKAITLQDDFTYTGLASHTIKAGAKVKMVEFNLTGSEKSVEEYLGFVQADGTLSTGNPPNLTDGNDWTHIINTPYGPLFRTPWSLPVAPGTADYKDNMFGIYIQDDWQVTRQLEANLGLRWDYEDNMLNNNYVMPADRAAALHGPDTRTGAAPGQTYAQSLAKGGINIDDYIGTGNRKAYKGAIAPRLGFSYDLFADKRSVVFGGWGRAYDRTVAELAQLEAFNNNSVKGEIWGLRNNYKAPYADQFSIGLRQQVGIWNAEVAYTNIKQYNKLVLFSGNRDPSGGFGSSGPADPMWGSIGGYGNLVLGDFVNNSQSDIVYLKVDKPYSKLSGWGATLAYTNTSGKTTNAEGNPDDPFSWTSGPGGKYAGTGLHAVNGVERHHFVATGIVDLPYGIALSGKLTLGSGVGYTAMNCGSSGCYWYPVEQASTKQLDVGLSTRIPMPNASAVVVRVDVINLTNEKNWSGYGRFPWDWNSLEPSSTGPMRTVKLGLRYTF